MYQFRFQYRYFAHNLFFLEFTILMFSVIIPTVVLQLLNTTTLLLIFNIFGRRGHRVLLFFVFLSPQLVNNQYIYICNLSTTSLPFFMALYFPFTRLHLATFLCNYTESSLVFTRILVELLFRYSPLIISSPKQALRNCSQIVTQSPTFSQAFQPRD